MAQGVTPGLAFRAGFLRVALRAQPEVAPLFRAQRVVLGPAAVGQIQILLLAPLARLLFFFFFAFLFFVFFLCFFFFFFYF